MKERHSYIGTLDGVNGVWCDQKPKGLKVKDTITFYSPDEDKVFVDKEGNMVDSVVIKDGVNIEDYVEIKKPKEEENGEERSEENNND